MIRTSIQLKNNWLDYFIFNETATTTLICFHGFGQEADDFDFLAKRYEGYRIIAINLFFHGKSNLNPPVALNENDWKLYLDKLFLKESVERFSVIGYSMGGRFALTTLQHFAAQMDYLYLIAPDGLVEGNWYRFATGSKTQRLLFKTVLRSYPSFLAIAKSLSNMGVLNKGLLKFAQVHLQSKEERNRVFNSWICFRKLVLSPKKLHKISLQHKVTVRIILGNYDRVIPVKRIVPKLIISPFITLQKVDITHHKLFYFDFLAL